jgi:hypothetical protein
LYKKGTVDESSYSWKDTLGTCDGSPGPFDSLQNYDSTTQFTSQFVLNSVTRAPITTWISISNTVRFYNGGAFDPNTNECPSSNAGFYVVVDGFSVDKFAKGSFILKFPWGKSWGTNGNMYFVFKSGDNYYTKDKCGFYIGRAYTLTA